MNSPKSIEHKEPLVRKESKVEPVDEAAQSPTPTPPAATLTRTSEPNPVPSNGAAAPKQHARRPRTPSPSATALQPQDANNQRVPTEEESPTSSSKENNRAGSPDSSTAGAANASGEKPTVGSAEWHRIRRENHKQVERRRRETINEGINEIARMVPGCEKNKGQILHRAAMYIRQLKEAESTTLEKWTLEKLLTDQAMNELNRQVDGLKSELEHARQEVDRLKRQLGEKSASTAPPPSKRAKTAKEAQN